MDFSDAADPVVAGRCLRRNANSAAIANAIKRNRDRPVWAGGVQSAAWGRPGFDVGQEADAGHAERQ